MNMKKMKNTFTEKPPQNSKMDFFTKMFHMKHFSLQKQAKNNIFSKKLHKNKHFIKHYSLPTFLKS